MQQSHPPYVVVEPSATDSLQLVNAFRDGQSRYIVKFDDGGSALRWYDAPLELGGELRDSGTRYRVVELTPARTPTGLGHARVAPL
jgi:hypothetical protein